MTRPSESRGLSRLCTINRVSSSRFIDSEADLDSAIKALLPLSQNPVQAYPELLKSGVVFRLIGLMSHDNADIMIDVVELIHELVDEDAGAENEDEEDDGESRENAIKTLVGTLVSHCQGSTF